MLSRKSCQSWRYRRRCPMPTGCEDRGQDQRAEDQRKQEHHQSEGTLRGVKPPVWRRLLVPGTMTLGDLHKAIQAAMGWRDCHLHAFDIGGEQFGDRRSVDVVVDENRPTLNG